MVLIKNIEFFRYSEIISPESGFNFYMLINLRQFLRRKFVVILFWLSS